MVDQTSSAVSRPTIGKVYRRPFASLRAIVALMLREMATTYGRSPMGYIWAVLEPVGGIALLTLIFSAGFRSPPLGNNFAIFYASGLVPFMLYSDIGSKVMGSLRYSRQLLIYPSVTYIDALLARLILNGLTQMLVGYILFTGILVLWETRTVLDLKQLGLAYAMAITLAFGIGTLNCFLTGMYPVWQRIWAIMTRPLFIISCVFFLFDTIPEPYRGYLWYNPLVHVVGQARAAFYPYYDTSYVNPTYVFSVGLVCLVLGLLFLRQYWRTILLK